MPSTRSLAALVGASLMAAVLPVLGTAPSQAADTTRTITTDPPIQYSCDYTVKTSDGIDLPLEGFVTTVAATFDVPSKIYPGQVIAPTPLKIEVGPQGLADAARGLLEARFAEGSSSDANLEITTAEGQSTIVPLGTLSAPSTPIPAEPTPWIIPATGTAPAITIPSTSRLRLSAPEKFSLEATIRREDGSVSATAQVPCRYISSDDFTKRPSRTIAYLKVSKLYPKLTTKAVPTDVVANRTRPTITVKGYSEATPTGTVNVLEGDKVLGTATLKNGAAAVRLPVFGRKGTRNLTVAYAGDVSNNAATSSTSITVR